MRPADYPERMRRARLSLEGLSIGDAFGERFFSRRPGDLLERIERRMLPDAPWRWTDDTAMALSVVEVLEARGSIDEEALAAAFVRRFGEDPERGYGGAAFGMLYRAVLGEDLRALARELFDKSGSYGNGAAMRVAPIGAYFADDLSACVEEAKKSAVVTHTHPEGQAGAIAVAVAAALAASRPLPSGAALLEATLSHVPPSETRAGIARARALLDENIPAPEAARELGSGARVSAQDTVPFSLFCAARFLGSFEEALWQTVSGLGDRDTTCAIVGGVVALSVGAEGIPVAFREAREPLPELASEAM